MARHQWQRVPESSLKSPLDSVYMFPIQAGCPPGCPDQPEEGWAVGDSGAIYHYFGGSWTAFASPVATSLNSVFKAVHKLQKEIYGKDAKFSLHSCFFVGDLDLARKFLKTLQTFGQDSKLYRATEAS